jgi:hypothetical protein
VVAKDKTSSALAQASSSDNCEDQCVDLVRPGRMRVACAQARPEMQDRRIIGDRVDIRRVDRRCRIAIDRGVDASVARDNLVNSAPIAPETIHERRIGMEEPTEGIHVVRVPCFLEMRSDFCRPHTVIHYAFPSRCPAGYSNSNVENSQIRHCLILSEQTTRKVDLAQQGKPELSGESTL